MLAFYNWTILFCTKSKTVIYRQITGQELFETEAGILQYRITHSCTPENDYFPVVDVNLQT